ncbi:dephospho-CoA kinase [Fredinandcohnia quinoae]|uniref:Dephospho-CoA kinase n=1 Tax=Fredinandcohnia quinoae TaxID=2918902 RepID=A0AAW5ECY4_9BACI|nr:dephospho-CoA kinase [Fredinandcohnia sp. SECRCQ15]MCH1627296.1 dephospho-CoA kinase [Fredinandcohnia sp. SECRCQ15]
MALVIGLTGGIASGKSTVSNLLKKMGIVVIDADIIARDVVEIGREAYYQIIEAFGPDILLPDKAIDRVKLGSIVFRDEKKRRLLNGIVHPAVRRQMLREKDNWITEGETVIIMDIPLLFESKLTSIVDRTLLVYVDADKQLTRLMARNNFNQEAAEARINSQMPLIDKISLADAVIYNNGTVEETKKQIEEILKKWDISI